MNVIIDHAGWVLFLWVFANQSGIPVPVVPSLVAAGALAGRGDASGALMLTAAVIAALGADMVWYGVGRWRGARALSLLCRFLPRPRTCADRVEQAFRAHDVGFQLLAQFLPELNPIAAGLAGATGVGLGRYLVIAGVTALMWAGTWMALGYVVPDAVVDLVAHVGLPWGVLATLAVASLGVVRYARRGRSRTGIVKPAVLVLLITGALSGCAAVGPDYRRPAVPTVPQWRTLSEGLGGGWAVQR